MGSCKTGQKQSVIIVFPLGFSWGFLSIAFLSLWIYPEQHHGVGRAQKRYLSPVWHSILRFPCCPVLCDFHLRRCVLQSFLDFDFSEGHFLILLPSLCYFQHWIFSTFWAAVLAIPFTLFKYVWADVSVVPAKRPIKHKNMQSHTLIIIMQHNSLFKERLKIRISFLF